MTVDTSGEFWKGTEDADLKELLRSDWVSEPAKVIKRSVCNECGSTTFRVATDDEQGFAMRICTRCDTEAFIADSEEYVDAAEPALCACPCGGDVFSVAVGFVIDGDGEIVWVYVALRCLNDDTMGVYTDWDIDYSPTEHLLSRV